MIQANRTQTNVPISTLVERGGGIPGLTLEIKIFNGEDLTEWLDFDDGDFKSVGHVDPTLVLTEPDATENPGMYAVDGGFDLSAINIPAAALSLGVRFDITAGGESGSDWETIQLTTDMLLDSLNRGADHNVKDSVGKQIRQGSTGGLDIESKDVVSATSTTVRLAATESAVDEFLTHRYIAIVEGLGVGQLRVVDSYVGATNTATVRAWDTTPDATSDYVLLLSAESSLTPAERVTLATVIDAALVAAHGAGSWITATGFATTADVVTLVGEHDATQVLIAALGPFGLTAAQDELLTYIHIHTGAVNGNKMNHTRATEGGPNGRAFSDDLTVDQTVIQVDADTATFEQVP